MTFDLDQAKQRYVQQRSGQNEFKLVCARARNDRWERRELRRRESAKAKAYLYAEAEPYRSAMGVIGWLWMAYKIARAVVWIVDVLMARESVPE